MASLSPPPIGGEAWLLADWVEFSALCDEFNVCRLKGILRVSDEGQDTENTSFVDQDSSSEQLFESLLEELSDRERRLNTAYPFCLLGDELAVSGELTNGSYAYLYCLFFSHVNRIDVIAESAPSDNKARDLMQICSTLAAAGFVKGNAISFGFPRPDHSNFLSALKNSFERIGEGTVRDVVLSGASEHQKDGEIDVIAWGNTSDETPGVFYLLGQVASGSNWSQKSVVGAIEPFHKIWFSEMPPSVPNPAMFIPFCLDRRGEVLNDVIQVHMYKFGKLFFRYNIPSLVNDGFHLLQENSSLYIDRENDFQEVIDYVENFRSSVLCA